MFQIILTVLVKSLFEKVFWKLHLFDQNTVKTVILRNVISIQNKNLYAQLLIESIIWIIIEIINYNNNTNTINVF